MRSIICVGDGRRGQPRAGHDGYKRRRGSKVQMAVDTLGHLIALTVTPANQQERAQVKALCEAVEAATGETGEVGSMQDSERIVR